MALSVAQSVRVQQLVSRWGFAVVSGLFLLALGCVYGLYRQHHIGASDYYGYYQQALLLRQGKVFLPVEHDVQSYPALVPLGYFAAGDRAVPLFPPGLPLLLALGGMVELQFFVLPLLGVLSCVYVYLLCQEHCGRWGAALLSANWALLPLVVYGSTHIMTDLAAAWAILASFYHYRRRQLPVAAALMGLGFMIRPSNALAMLAFTPLLLRDRQFWRFSCWLALPVSLHALYNALVFGLPWRTGYGQIGWAFSSNVFGPQISFYCRQTLLQLGPLLLLLALLALRRPSWEKATWLGWFLTFFVAYSFWRSGHDRWWWARYLLPGYGALFLLAACGLGELRQSARPAAVWGWRAAAAVLALMPLYYVHFGLDQRDLWIRDRAHEYFDLTQEVARLVPPGSYVGSVEFSGAFRLYSPGIVSFLSTHENAPAVVAKALAEGHAAYLVLEPPNRGDRTIRRLLRQYDARQLAELPVLWPRLPVYQLLPKASR